MSKKNKNKKKPAVGSPAAGSNNKRENLIKEKTENQKVDNNQNNQPKAEPQKVEPKKIEPRKEEPILQKLPEAPEVKSDENLAKKSKRPMMVVAGVFVLAFAVICALLFGNATVPANVKNAEFKGRLEPDSVATKSVLSASQQSKLAKTVKSKGNTGAFAFYVNESISLDEHTDPALIEFGNNATNECVLVAFILDESNEIIYRSLGVEPGEEIRSVVLFDSVSYGTQEATLVVNGYEADTYKKIGTQTVKIDLKIGVDEVEK